METAEKTIESTEERGVVSMSPSTPLLDAVLMANNKWRCEMWALRLHKSTPPEISRMVATIMGRQLELEEEAKASNAPALADSGEEQIVETQEKER